MLQVATSPSRTPACHGNHRNTFAENVYFFVFTIQTEESFLLNVYNSKEGLLARGIPPVGVVMDDKSRPSALQHLQLRK